MSDNRNVTWLRNHLASEAALEPPVVQELEPAIRSGDQFLITSPIRDRRKREKILDQFDPSRTESDDEQEPKGGRNWDNAKKKPLLGPIVLEWGYDVSPVRRAEFKTFLRNFEGELARISPSGVRYRGTYAVLAQAEPNTGNFRTAWTLRNLRAMDRFSYEVDSSDGVTAFGAMILRFKALQEKTGDSTQRIYQVAWPTKRLK